MFLYSPLDTSPADGFLHVLTEDLVAGEVVDAHVWLSMAVGVCV